MTRRRSRLAGCALAVLASLATLAVLEVGARVWAARARDAAERRPDVPLFIRRDATLGWRAMPDRDIALAPGRRFTTGRRGWRRYDDRGARPLLVVVGDSYTHAAGVADGAVYYDVLARRLDVGVAALAVNGYGTVQQWLVARDAARELGRPAAMLLQATDNDPINNSLALERRSYLNNNLMPRPYLDDAGGAGLGDPRRLHERLVLGREVTRRGLAGRWPTIETAIEAGAPEALELYRREVRHTGRALRLLRGVFPDVPAVAFNVGGSESRMARDLARLAREAGFRYVDVGPRLRAEARGREIFQDDGAHWNATGHAIAGDILTEALRAELTARR